MKKSSLHGESYLRELRLFLEEICCDLSRFQHVAQDGVQPEDILINQEVYLGIAGAFADIEVRVPGNAPYFVEIKYGYPPDKIIRHINRKYGTPTQANREASKIVLVVDSESYDNWSEIENDIRACLRPGLSLEVWGEEKLLSLISKQFDLEINNLTEGEIAELHNAIDRAKGVHAFGESFSNDPLQSSLIWHFGFWVLRRLRESDNSTPRTIMVPGLYKSVVVIFADLSCFSSYVRDTRDDDVVRHVLTSFYSKARYQVLSYGGMLYQFLGDGVLALFGVLDRKESYVEDALSCAKALVDIGNSVSNEWQRQIDHLQSAGGCHIGMAIGELNIMSLRPFSRAHMGAIADSINTAARLSSNAAPDEIVVSNALFQKLDEESQAKFQEMEPVEARNIGRIRAWKLSLAGKD
ncbi:MAG TPA: adenylate/guanylate cyclase domain-containing protein [Blastocatellia bacterium]|nr:adenylate/guanylate cyclase domain-containing protein [Blastocatellia bacterium]